MPSRFVTTQTKQVVNASTGPSTTTTYDLDVSGWAVLNVSWSLLATTTTTDLSNPIARLLNVDGTPLLGITYPAIRSVAASSDATNVNAYAVYDVRGLDKIRLQATNNNAGSKTLVITTYLGTT